MPVRGVDEDGLAEGVRVAGTEEFLVELECFVHVAGRGAQQRHELRQAEVRQLLHVRIDQDLERPACKLLISYGNFFMIGNSSLPNCKPNVGSCCRHG